MRLRIATLIVAAVACSLPAAAQPEELDQPRRSRSFSSMLNTDLLIDNYSRLLARKYKLTDDQEAYTNEFVRVKAHEFLDNHRDEVFDLVDRMFEVRAGGDMDQTELLEWGRRALPLYNEAKLLIIDGNQEWREILDDEQKLIHDEDLKLMHEGFQMSEAHLERVVTGEMTVEEFRQPLRIQPRQSNTTARRSDDGWQGDRHEALPPPPPAITTPKAATGGTQPRVAPRQPDVKNDTGRAARPTPRPPAMAHRVPDPGRTPSEPPPDQGRRTVPTPAGRQNADSYESDWDKYVAVFIERYELNEGQAQKAHTILKSCKEQAAQVMRRNRGKIEQYDKQIDDLKKSADKNDKQKLAKLTEQRDKLLQPLNQIFDKRLKPHLEKLPTRAQREAAEANAKKPRSKPKPDGRGGGNAGP